MTFSGGNLGLVCNNIWFSSNKKYNTKNKDPSGIGFNIWNFEDKEAEVINKAEDFIFFKVKNEKSGIQGFMPLNIYEGHRYGLALKLDKKEIDGIQYTDYIAYAINLGILTSHNYRVPLYEKELNYFRSWIYVATIRRPGCHYTSPDFNQTSIGGLVENIGSFNGHLFHRKVIFGNDFVHNGKEWIAAKELIYVNKDPNNSVCRQVCGTMMEVGIGGNVAGRYESGYKIEVKNSKIPNHLHDIL